MRIVSSTTLLGKNLIFDMMIASISFKSTLVKIKPPLLCRKVKYSIGEGKALCDTEDWLDELEFKGVTLSSQRIAEFLRSLNMEIQNSFYACLRNKLRNLTLKVFPWYTHEYK